MNILLADHSACEGLFVTVQREVAERLAAAPGSKDYGPISILAQAVASVKIIGSLPPECFWPRPEVHSAMLALRRLPEPLTRTPRALVDFAQRVFEKRRKQLGAILGRNRPWPAGIEAIMRAEDLSVADFVKLEAAFGDVFAA
jgi:16S rRNA (adenine1518-N6/adenine1519-N6)-dimethyltransferase